MYCLQCWTFIHNKFEKLDSSFRVLRKKNYRHTNVRYSRRSIGCRMFWSKKPFAKNGVLKVSTDQTLENKNPNIHNVNLIKPQEFDIVIIWRQKKMIVFVLLFLTDRENCVVIDDDAGRPAEMHCRRRSAITDMTDRNGHSHHAILRTCIQCVLHIPVTRYIYLRTVLRR